jgi:hypothetical protein
MTFTFKVWENIKKAWGLYKENFSQMMILTLIMLAIQFISKSLSKDNSNSLLVFILVIVSILVSYIWIRSTLSLLDGKGFNPFSKESLPSFAQIWDFVKTNILLALCVVPFFIIPVFVTAMIVVSSVLAGIGPVITLSMLIILIPLFILFIIPAIYVASRLFPAKYLSVDKYQGARKNIRESWNMTKGIGWKITGKILLVALFILLGFVAFVVGLIITLPIGMIVLTMMYRDIAKLKNESIASVVESPVAPMTPEAIPVEKEEIKEEVK